MRAEVGDEQHGDDPTVHALCDRMAALLGKEAAVFLPSGTMCNEVAILTHCRPGRRDPGARDRAYHHHRRRRARRPAGVAGHWACRATRGQFRRRRRCARRSARSAAIPRRRRLVEVEQTANIGGGSVWPVDRLNAVADVAHEHGMATHMDGARLMNAVVAAGVAGARDGAPAATPSGSTSPRASARRSARCCADRPISSTKPGAGSSASAARCARPGICAAACLYALDHNIDRLAEDHANAKALARGLAQIPGMTVEQPDTNLVFFDTAGTGLTAEELAEPDRAREGVLISPWAGTAPAPARISTWTLTRIDTAIQVIARTASA